MGGLGVPEVIIIFLLGLFLFGFIAVIAVAISWRSKRPGPEAGDNAALQDRVSRLEQKLEAIQQVLGVDPRPAGPPGKGAVESMEREG